VLIAMVQVEREKDADVLLQALRQRIMAAG
jgi:hypothetical protein